MNNKKFLAIAKRWFDKINGKYYHSVKITDLETGKVYNIDVRTQSNIILQSFQDWLESKRIDFCEQIYKELQKEYEYLTSDEAIKERFIANDYTFESDGSMRNE
jgi:hypothetical protein